MTEEAGRTHAQKYNSQLVFDTMELELEIVERTFAKAVGRRQKQFRDDKGNGKEPRN